MILVALSASTCPSGSSPVYHRSMDLRDLIRFTWVSTDERFW